METTDTNSTKEMNKDAVDKKKAKRNRTPFSEMRISFMKNMGKDVSDEYENESGKYVKTDKKPDEPKQELRMKMTKKPYEPKQELRMKMTKKPDEPKQELRMKMTKKPDEPTQELRMKKTLTGIEKE